MLSINIQLADIVNLLANITLFMIFVFVFFSDNCLNINSMHFCSFCTFLLLWSTVQIYIISGVLFTL